MELCTDIQAAVGVYLADGIYKHMVRVRQLLIMATYPRTLTYGSSESHWQVFNERFPKQSCSETRRVVEMFGPAHAWLHSN